MPGSLDLFTSAESARKARGIKPDTTPPPTDEANAKPVSNEDTLDTYYSKWTKHQDPMFMNHIVKKAFPIISSSLVTYGGTNNKLMTSRAKKIAIDAVKSFDPKNAASLSSWIALNLQGLQRYANNLSPISVPERVKLDAFHINKHFQEFSNEVGREPNDAELADLCGLSPKRINYVRKMVRPILNEGSFMESDDEDSSYMPGIQTNEWENVWAEYVYNDLDPINKSIYDMRMGRGIHKGKPMDVNAIAKKLQMSPAAVSQRSNKIANMLAEGYNYQGSI